LVPALAPLRDAALQPLRARVAAARATLDALRAEYSEPVDTATRIAPAALRPRLQVEAFRKVANLHDLAEQLRAAFDHAEPVEARRHIRAAYGAVTDLEFGSVLVALKKEADTYATSVAHVQRMADQFAGLLDALEASGCSIWADSFQPAPPMVPGGGLAARGDA